MTKESGWWQVVPVGTTVRWGALVTKMHATQMTPRTLAQAARDGRLGETTWSEDEADEWLRKIAEDVAVMEYIAVHPGTVELTEDMREDAIDDAGLYDVLCVEDPLDYDEMLDYIIARCV